MTKRIIAFVVIACVVAGLLVYSQHRSEPLKVSGFIEANEIRVGSRVGGRVRQVAVEEGQEVDKGHLLVELEPFDLLQRRSEAAAKLAQRNADHEKLEAGYRDEEIAQAKARRDQLAAHLEELEHGPRKQEIEAAKAEVDLAEAEMEFAADEFDRTQSLFAKETVSRERLDEARTQLRVARARVRAKTEKLALLEAGTRPEQIAQAKARLEEADQAWKLMERGYRKEEIAGAKAAVDAAQAALGAIDQQVEELKVVSPVDGIVEAVDLEPGDLVTANAPVISLMDTSDLWVRAYVPENELDLNVGQKVKVTVDSYPDREFSGQISFVARQAEFTPGNVQTPEERSKQVFRIKVTLEDDLGELRPGMAADVWLQAGSDTP